MLSSSKFTISLENGGVITVHLVKRWCRDFENCQTDILDDY